MKYYWFKTKSSIVCNPTENYFTFSGQDRLEVHVLNLNRDTVTILDRIYPGFNKKIVYVKISIETIDQRTFNKLKQIDPDYQVTED